MRARQVQREGAALLDSTRLWVRIDHRLNHQVHRFDARRERLGGIAGDRLHARQVQRQIAFALALCDEFGALGVDLEKFFDDRSIRLRLARVVQRQVALVVELGHIRLVRCIVLDDLCLDFRTLDAEDHIILLLQFLEDLLAILLSGRHGAEGGPYLRSPGPAARRFGLCYAAA